MMRSLERFRDYYVPRLPYPAFGKKVTPGMRQHNNAWLREHGERFATRWAKLSIAIWVAAFVVRHETALYLMIGFVGLAAGGALATMMWLNHMADTE